MIKRDILYFYINCTAKNWILKTEISCCNDRLENIFFSCFSAHTLSRSTKVGKKKKNWEKKEVPILTEMELSTIGLGFVDRKEIIHGNNF